MIVSWYEFALFHNPDLVDDSDLSDDGDFIDDLNSELDWWEYQEQTWLAIGRYHHYQEFIIMNSCHYVYAYKFLHTYKCAHMHGHTHTHTHTHTYMHARTHTSTHCSLLIIIPWASMVCLRYTAEAQWPQARGLRVYISDEPWHYVTLLYTNCVWASAKQLNLIHK